MIYFDEKKWSEQDLTSKFSTIRSPMYDHKTSKRIYERSVLFKKPKPFNFSGTPSTIQGR